MDAVYRFALRLSRDPDRAQDLTQETFLRAYKHWASYVPGTRARSWLFTICRNLFLRGEERKRRHEEIVTTATAEDPRWISREPGVFTAVQDHDPEGTFWWSMVDDEVMHAVDALPLEFKEAIVLSDLEGLPYHDVAEILDVPVGTVKSRLYRGRRRLQEALFEYATSVGIIPDVPAEVNAEDKETTR